jgi:hypothetical protein
VGNSKSANKRDYNDKKTTEDFTALLEMHPLKHMTLGRERESTPNPPMILYAR